MEDIDMLLDRNKPKPASRDAGATGAAAAATEPAATAGGGFLSRSGDFPAGTVPAQGEFCGKPSVLFGMPLQVHGAPPVGTLL